MCIIDFLMWTFILFCIAIGFCMFITFVAMTIEIMSNAIEHFINRIRKR